MAAPQVIAKGTDLVALKIREIAGAHQIPVLESPMLARASMPMPIWIRPSLPRSTPPWPRCWPMSIVSRLH
jgi:type III secretion system FlhB-like substrate exporter